MLAAGQLGWLHSVPEQTTGGKKIQWPHSRGYRIQSVLGQELPMPKLGEFERTVFEAFLDIGCASAGLEGPTPITWTEMNAWNSINGYLTPSECTSVIQMSKSYVSGLHAGRDMLSKDPMTRKAEEDDG